MTREKEELRAGALKVVVRGAGIFFVGIFLSKILTYIYRVFIARYFGPADYGVFSISLALIGFFSTIVLLGLSVGTERYVAYYRAKKDERRVKGVITSSLKIVFPLSILMSLLLLFLSPYLAVHVFHNEGMTNVLMILSLSIPFSSIFMLFIANFVGFKKIEYQVYTENIFQNVLRTVLIIIFGLLGFGIFGLAWAWTIAAILTFFLSFYFLEKIFPIIRTKIVSIPLKKELVMYSLPLLLVNFMHFIIMWTDTLMLGIFKDASDVGIYNAALPTAQLLLIIPIVLTSLFLPVITGLYAKKRKSDVKNVYKTVTRWIFYINFPLFLLLIFFSKEVLNVVFGPVYVAGYLAVILLSIGHIFSVFAKTSYHILNMLKKTRTVMYITIINAFVNVLLNYLLIPVYGITGAATATMTTYIVSCCLVLSFSFRSMKMLPISPNLIKSVFAGVLSVGIVYSVFHLLFTDFSIYILVAVFIVFIFIYSFTILVLRSFVKEDMEIMKAIENKTRFKMQFLRKILKRFV